MAESGINWGKIALGALAITGVALVAPSILSGLSETLSQNAASGSTLASIAENTQGAANWISNNVSSVFGAIGTTVTSAELQSLDGVWGALSNTGQNAINLAGQNIPATAAALGTTAVAGAAIGQWTSKAAASGSKPSAPGGMNYAQYVEARRRMAAAAPPTRTA